MSQTQKAPSDANKGTRILARSFFKELRGNGYSHSQILALSTVLAPWLAALIVAVVLLAGAGVTALLGKRRVEEAAPPVPTMAVENLKQDVDAVRHPENH